MAIDTAEKRRTAAGVSPVGGPSVTLNSSKDSEWRSQVAKSYSLPDSSFWNANGVSMTYGEYSFEPVPLIRSSKEYIKTQNQQNIGFTHRYTLDGTLLDLVNTSVTGVIYEQRRLREAFNADGKYFTVRCGDTILLEGYPRVSTIDFQPTSDNWVISTDYTLDIEFDDFPIVDVDPVFDEYVQEFTEDWNLEFDQQNYYSLNLASGTDVGPYLLRLTHNLSAKGKSHYSGPGLTGTLDKPAWQQAKDYVSTKLGVDGNILYSNSLNLTTGEYGYFDHLRVIKLDETDGTYGITETWAILYTGHAGLQRNAVEDFTVNIQKNNNAELNSVSINGQIQGLESRTYNNSGIGDFTVTQNKFDAAENYFDELITYGYLISRAQNLAADENITVNPDEVISIVGKSPNNGVVNYTYTYDDRPTNCITGSKFESIVITNTNPSDVFNEIVVMGRPQGPIIQKMNTVTETSRSVDINLLMENKGSCINLTGGPHSQVNSILCSIYTDLTGTYDKVFKTTDSESWNPKNGRYRRSVAWSATDCDDIPSTTIC